jgi:hypothetical protein
MRDLENLKIPSVIHEILAKTKDIEFQMQGKRKKNVQKVC